MLPLDVITDDGLLFVADHAVYHLEKSGNKFDAEVIKELQKRYDEELEYTKYLKGIINKGKLGYIADASTNRRVRKMLQKENSK